MRGLAEYAMTGRRQAVTVVVLLGLIPLLNLLAGAIVALVVLRKGLQEGLLVLLWALLPAGLQWMLGDTTPVFLLVGVTALAQALRNSQSWPRTLLFATGIGLALQLSLVFQQDYVNDVRSMVTELMAEGQSVQVARDGELAAGSPDDVVALWMSAYGAGHFMLFAGCLMLGRAMQAKLYNPGGFREEFHNLRFARGVMAALLALIMIGLFGVAPLNEWVLVLCMVPMLNGLAVIHSVVASRKLGASMLAMAYMVLLFMGPAVVMLGFLDSVLDIRKRAGSK